MGIRQFHGKMLFSETPNVLLRSWGVDLTLTKYMQCLELVRQVHCTCFRDKQPTIEDIIFFINLFPGRVMLFFFMSSYKNPNGMHIIRPWFSSVWTPRCQPYVFVPLAAAIFLTVLSSRSLCIICWAHSCTAPSQLNVIASSSSSSSFVFSVSSVGSG
jgi:hypothetical protein